MKKTNTDKRAKMLEEYDFSHGVRGKYAARYAEGTNIVVLDKDVMDVFPNAEAASRALKALAEIIRSQPKQKAR
jgi:hypothetical protein